MYEAVLALHNLVRWLVLFFGLWALFRPEPRPGALFAHALAPGGARGVRRVFVRP